MLKILTCITKYAFLLCIAFILSAGLTNVYASEAAPALIYVSPTFTPANTPLPSETPPPSESPLPPESPPPSNEPQQTPPADEVLPDGEGSDDGISPDSDMPPDSEIVKGWWEQFDLSLTNIILLSVGVFGIICLAVAVPLFITAAKKKNKATTAASAAMQASAAAAASAAMAANAAAAVAGSTSPVASPHTIPPTAAYNNLASTQSSIILIGNAHHIGARDSQQDSFCISDVQNESLMQSKGLLGVVADGMGGLADGAEISAIVTRTMLNHFNDTPASSKPEQELLDMVYTANDNVLDFISKQKESGGSTVVAVNIIGDKLYWISVGDSHIYLVRNGTLMQLNRDHTYAQELDEKAADGEITWEEAMNHPKRAALTSYLGTKTPELIDRNQKPIQLINGDRILLMSDGVFGTLSDEDILETMVLIPQESATVLMEKTIAQQHPHQDNLTAVILEYRAT